MSEPRFFVVRASTTGESHCFEFGDHSDRYDKSTTILYRVELPADYAFDLSTTIALYKRGVRLKVKT